VTDATATQGIDHARALAKAARTDGYGAVIAVGGDGTANEVINGLSGSTTRFACLPAGSTNALAKMLGLPCELGAATAALVARSQRAKRRQIDLGCLNGRFFALSAGIGLDASIARRVQRRPHLKRWFRHWYYLPESVRTFLTEYRTNPPRLRMVAAGEPDSGVSVFVQNGPHYTFFGRRPLDLVPDGSFDNGSFRAAVLDQATVADVGPALRVLFGHGPVDAHPKVRLTPACQRIEVRSADERVLPLVADGECLPSSTEAVLTVHEKALEVLA
jgi:diacylglycerol kinase family enzyme